MPERKSAVVPTIVAAVAAIVALVMVAAPAVFDDGQDSGGTGAQQSDSASDQTWERLVRREPDDPMARGDVDAPVVMIEYADFQCPFCGKFARDTEPKLIEQYVEDGTLRIEWVDFPYLGPESMTAALAGRAAAEQGKFWEFHEAMYADQLPPNSGRLDDDYLTGIAGGVGLDVDRFQKDMRSAEAKRAVEADFTEGQAIGVTGTPTFVINGVPVVGAQPLEVFEDTIEQAAAEAGS